MSTTPQFTTTGHRSATTPLVLLDCIDQAILVLGDGHSIKYANHAALTLMEPSSGTSALDHLDATRFVETADLELALSRLDEIGSVTSRVRPPSRPQPFEMSLTDHRATPGIEGVVASFRSLEHEDVLDARAELHRRQAEHLLTALTDEVTGLPARRLFIERLAECLHARKPGEALSVFFIDLDGFKAINDALGHTAGDAMLRSTAERLLRVVPQVEQWGRVAGDEFVLFVENCGLDEAEAYASSIATALRKSIVLGGRTLHTSASIGLTIVDAEVDAETAVRRADIAMNEGKRNGPDSLTLFTGEMERHVVIRAELEGQLRSTLTGSGPDVVFQPVVDLATGRTIAVEALARWHSPTQGPIGPDRFVSLAENIGMVDALDRHVMRKACREIAGHVEPASGWPLDLTVNSSTISLSHPGAAERILQILSDEGFAPHRLILEITESTAIEDDELLRSQLQVLRSQGVRIAIDDFGTGHSSLAQLETLPVDFVKMDRSFLEGVPGSKRRMRYLETIIAMANALRLEVIFEGIEDPAQAHVLAELGVELGQGYLLAEPVRPAQLESRMVQAREVVLDTVRAGADWQPVLEWNSTPPTESPWFTI